MLLMLDADRDNQGFTLIEILVILAIVGILASIGVPSFLAMNNRAKLNSSLSNLSSAIQEVQRTAIRTTKSCTISFPSSGTDNPTIASSCLISGNLMLNGINMRNNITSIVFNFRGDTSTSSASKGTIVLSLPGNTGDPKCLVIGPGIGTMGTGNYDPSDTTGTDPNKCSS